jgi:Co/Zn/Cd efflux system component
MKRSTRLSVAIGISFVFFLAEIGGEHFVCWQWRQADVVAVGFKTHSIALIADAFHYVLSCSSVQGVADPSLA